MKLRRFLTATVAVLPLTLSGVALAEVKLAYVDLQRALVEIEEGRTAKARLQKMLEDKQKELDREQEALRKEQEVLQKQASAMSEETRNQKALELQKKVYDLAQKWEKGKAEMAQRERTELQAIFNKMDPIIAQIAQREGFSMVLEKSDSGLVWAQASLDLTNELVRLYNAQPKGKAAPKDAPKPAAPKADVPKAADVPKK